MTNLGAHKGIILSTMTALVAVLAPGCMMDSADDGYFEEVRGADGNSPSDVATNTGNGGPSGPHYNLNIIGMDKAKTVSGGEGHRIFVSLAGTTKIRLSEGDFAVLDANGTDGTAAFQLPNPDPDGDGVTSYSVFVRALGKPGGSSTTTACGTEPDTGDTVCSVESVVLVRNKGGSKFTNVSRELLYVQADLDGDGKVDKVPLFGDELEDFFWQYDNQGLRLAQFRFYEVATDTN